MASQLVALYSRVAHRFSRPLLDAIPASLISDNPQLTMNRTSNQGPPSANLGRILVETRDFCIFRVAPQIGQDLS
jgi:hypothetical protein